jgi:hypothetical protein
MEMSVWPFSPLTDTFVKAGDIAPFIMVIISLPDKLQSKPLPGRVDLGLLIGQFEIGASYLTIVVPT